MNKQELRAFINALPMQRPVGIPDCPSSELIYCFFDAEHFRKAGIAFTEQERACFVLARSESSLSEIREKLDPRFCELERVGGMCARHVVLVTEGAERNHIVKMARALRLARREFFFISNMPQGKRHPDLLSKELDRVLDIVNTLADEESVRVYLSRLKSLLHGQPGFNKVATYGQYFHPLVKPMPGEVVCDGGVGTKLVTPATFSRLVGRKGHVYGFEPISAMYDSLADQAKDFENVEVVQMGLWDTAGEMDFYVAGDVSTFRDLGVREREKETCQLTSIDAFFSKKERQPDLIKLDIEGAEQRALRGAHGVISETKPKLMTCLYHSVSDFLEIPALVKATAPGYELFVGHHTPFNNECVLYARHP